MKGRRYGWCVVVLGLMWSSSMAVVAASEPVRHPLHAAQPAAAPDEMLLIEAFFRVYKDLAQGGNPVQLEGFAKALEARSLIERSLQRFSRAAVD